MNHLKRILGAAAVLPTALSWAPQACAQDNTIDAIQQRHSYWFKTQDWTTLVPE